MHVHTVRTYIHARTYVCVCCVFKSLYVCTVCLCTVSEPFIEFVNVCTYIHTYILLHA